MTTNANIKRSSILIDPTDELNDKLNAFDSIMTETFGDEISHIKHELWSEHVSFTSIKFVNGDYIGFRVSAKGVIDDTYNASKEHLRKAFRAFSIEMLSKNSKELLAHLTVELNPQRVRVDSIGTEWTDSAAGPTASASSR